MDPALPHPYSSILTV